MQKTIILLSCLLAAFAAQAQDWPARAVHFVVPYPPGGGTDVIARIVQSRLAEALGQQSRRHGQFLRAGADNGDARIQAQRIDCVHDCIVGRWIAGRSLQQPPPQDIQARMRIAGLPRQRAPDLDRIGPAREDGDAVEAWLLSLPQRPVARVADCRQRKFVVVDAKFLQARDVRPRVAQPIEELRQPPANAVDVEGRDSHA